MGLCLSLVTNEGPNPAAGSNRRKCDLGKETALRIPQSAAKSINLAAE
jgi:hypothetical protein